MSDNGNHVEGEARAAVMWGESREAVVRMMRAAGLSATEADKRCEALMRERAAAIREIGVREILVGGAMVLLPIAFWLWIRFGPPRLWTRLFSCAAAIGLFGVWKLTQGAVKAAAPGSVTGPVADMGD